MWIRRFSAPWGLNGGERSTYNRRTTLMVICPCGLLPNPAKVSKFKYTAWWYSTVQKFHNDGKKNSRITILNLFWPTAMIRPKSQYFKIGHDGILSIGNFILMIKINILLFQLPGNWPTTKKCAPYFRGNTQFPIYSIHYWSMIHIECLPN
jgi:hypothetical protein